MSYAELLTQQQIERIHGASLEILSGGRAESALCSGAGGVYQIRLFCRWRNWLVHNLRVQTVELDNFAQDLISKVETEYLED